ncbi:hypothetical protein [Streptosporangium sp. NPDC000396]|uniref:hypothetical protein n=1 Tax=Streptosporangium sp. NPDC000396 TaxID=3366185 RepID=UPI0036C4D7A5
MRAKLPHLLKLLAGAGETHLEPFDLAEPATFRRFTDSLMKVRDDLCEPHRLCRIWLQHRTSQADLTELILIGWEDHGLRARQQRVIEQHVRRQVFGVSLVVLT